MIRLEKRPTPSRFSVHATPIVAVLLTMVAGGIMFAMLGKNPFDAIRTIFWDPSVQPAICRLFAAATLGQGRAADLDRDRIGIGVSGGNLASGPRGSISWARCLARVWAWLFTPSRIGMCFH